MNNPRDNGFNYGRAALWRHFQPIPPEYFRTRALANAVGKLATAYSAASWNLEMALRDVRNAETPDQLAMAIAALEKARTDNDIIGIDHTYNVANMPNEPEIV